mmetsp:Transcript_12526/g.19788  ORF Transcript_12526/g.19788 Transcript_12526/m.19788 type:complete len:85 (-) Transcript_12526:142-396(-)
MLLSEDSNDGVGASLLRDGHSALFSDKTVSFDWESSLDLIPASFGLDVDTFFAGDGDDDDKLTLRDCRGRLVDKTFTEFLTASD